MTLTHLPLVGGQGAEDNYRRSVSQTLFLITEGKFSRFTSGTLLAAPRNASPAYDDGAKLQFFLKYYSSLSFFYLRVQRYKKNSKVHLSILSILLVHFVHFVHFEWTAKNIDEMGDF